ncbi:MAG: hypothetical protein OSB68_08300 [Dehalococcoidia bacterium]|nr:hypothetical protein [Dehalococcoidia bacterium]
MVIAVDPMLDRVLEAIADLDVTVLYATTEMRFDSWMQRYWCSRGCSCRAVHTRYFGFRSVWCIARSAASTDVAWYARYGEM